MNNENENKRLMGRMEAEIASLTEAKAAIEKAEEAVRKAGTVCEWLYGHAEEKFTLKNMAQKYEAEISQRAKLSSAAECLMKMGAQLLYKYAINSPNNRQNCQNIDVLVLTTKKTLHIKCVQNVIGGHGYGKERIHDNTRGTGHASRQRTDSS